jgi:hypothetical protein
MILVVLSPEHLNSLVHTTPVLKSFNQFNDPCTKLNGVAVKSQWQQSIAQKVTTTTTTIQLLHRSNETKDEMI